MTITRNSLSRISCAVAAGLVLSFSAGPAYAASSHALNMYGTAKYRSGFDHFDYADPSAPKGGAIKLAEMGTFDTLNPFILKGVKAPGISLLYESLMVNSYDEPRTMYGLLAKSVEVADDGKTVEFVMRPEAKWHDGTPVTADDVVYSFDKLKNEGDPTYRILYAPIASVEKTGPGKVRFTFSDTQNLELPLIAAEMPVLPKHYFEKVGFEKATLDPPLGSGPYKVESLDAGRSITYGRVDDYWGKNLGVNRGQYNFDRIIYDMYLDEYSSLIAFKSGAYDFRREYIARNWATAYDDAPSVQDGRVIKREVPHKVPQGMQAFLINSRHSRFEDWRVRRAIGLTMDFEWLNRTIFYDAYTRNDSFFVSTPFSAANNLPSKKELEILERFRGELPEEVFNEEPKVPKTDGSGNERANLVFAQKLLEEAGWVVKDGKRVNAKTGEELHIDFLLRQPTMERVIAPMRKRLERLGIVSYIRRVDDAQYQKRLDSRDFDIISIWVNRGVFFPGNEQVALWHSSQAEIKGSNNLAGVNNPAVDAALERLTSARTLEELIPAGRALDRVLLWQHYVIPHWRSQSFRIAYWDKFGMPKTTPKYDLGLMTWWAKEDNTDKNQ